MKYNFITETIEYIHLLKNQIRGQPDYFAFDDQQRCLLLASTDDALLIETHSGDEIDIDERYKIQFIRAIKFHNNNFYILANRFENRLGIYLIEFCSHNDPFCEPRFLLKETSHYLIGDAAIDFIDGAQDSYLVVSYKAIYINSYIVSVINIKNGMIKYQH